MLIRRLATFVRESFPLAFYVPFAVVWAFGATALPAVVDHRIHGWTPGWGTGVSALTIVIDLLLLRAMDDIRDLDYDRVRNPGRTLARGAVRVGDLLLLLVAGSAALLALNAGRGVAVLVLAAHLAYAVALLVTDRVFGWPPGDRMIGTLLVSYPIQLLMCGYLYTSLIRTYHLTPSPVGMLACVAVTFVILHMEFARKTVRRPQPDERTYVHTLGVNGTAATALALAVAASVLAIGLARPWDPNAAAYGWGWLALLPLALPATAVHRFWRRGEQRWPLKFALLHTLAALPVFFAIGLLAKGDV